MSERLWGRQRPGDKFKILQAAEGEKKKQPKSSNDDNSQTKTNTEVKGSHSQENDHEWKRQRQLTVSSRLNFAKREQDNMRQKLLLKTLNRI